MKQLLLFAVLLGMTQAVAQESDYLPLAREGVKWVNEKVIVNNGDTTRYYYNYEFCGMDTACPGMSGVLYHACYYYLGDQLDVEQDSLIASLRDLTDPAALHTVICMRNYAYEIGSIGIDDVIFLLPVYGDGVKLYDFRTFLGPKYYQTCQWYWTTYADYEEILTEDNYIEIEPVEIEGVECSRFALLGDDGEPLAYVVEGIGFDSRDMGDLLRPFSRQPDPNADHQEWCGLSHVIKDGKVIYKGMRYRHGAFTGIDEVVADGARRPLDPNYYNLMGQPVGHDVPTTPGIYIHQGKKIVVR